MFGVQTKFDQRTLYSICELAFGVQTLSSVCERCVLSAKIHDRSLNFKFGQRTLMFRQRTLYSVCEHLRLECKR